MSKLKKAYVRPLGDGDSRVYVLNKKGKEIVLDTPCFEEYGEEALWCYEHGYEPIYE